MPRSFSAPTVLPGSALVHRLSAPAMPPSGAVLLLHGVGSNESDLLGLADGLADDVLIASLRAPLPLSPTQFAWFAVRFTPQGPQIEAAQAEASRQALIGFTQALQAAYGIAPRRTVIAGFSQGGIMSASAALSMPALYGGFAILSGRILPELAPHIADRAALSHLRALVAHGSYDSKLPPSWAERSDQWLAELGVNTTSRRYLIDHGICAEEQRDWLQWISPWLQEPTP